MLVLKQYIVMDRSTRLISARQLLALHAPADTGVRARSTSMVALKGILPTVQTQVEPIHSIAVGSRRQVATADPPAIDDNGGDPALTSGERLVVMAALIGKYKSKWQHLLLFLAGAAVLVIHLHTTTAAVLSHTKGCLLEVRPWFVTSSSCVALEINCANGEYSDGSDIAALNSHVEDLVASALKSLVFASCSRLHIPPIIQRFPGLQMIKIYNSTVEQWDFDVELRGDLHPDLQLLYISDSNFCGSGELPVGLLGGNFPNTLIDVEFSGTNVMKFPSDLHNKWTTMQFFVLERSRMITEIPEPLIKMKIPQLYLNSNGIVKIPDGLLADQAFMTLNLNGNPLEALPDTIGDLSSFYRIGAAHTNISELPPWLAGAQHDTIAGEPVIPFLGYAIFLAGGTPLCEDTTLREIAVNTKQDWVRLNCSTSTPTHVYPIDEERKWRAASLASFN